MSMSNKNAQECVFAEGGTAHRLGQVETYLTVREVLFRAQPSRQKRDYCASAAVFTGVGMEH
jgi:hypothetical protein